MRLIGSWSTCQAIFLVRLKARICQALPNSPSDTISTPSHSSQGSTSAETEDYGLSMYTLGSASHPSALSTQSDKHPLNDTCDPHAASC